jgi:signal transduction histidine kinase
MVKTSLMCISVLATALIGSAQVSDAAKKLAQETETYCASTASTKPTPEMIIAKVDEACSLLEKEGTKAFPKFKGKSSKFIFAGTYIWINDMNGKMLMHPIKPAMEGQDLIGLKDSNGKRFFVDMIAVAKEKGNGWVDYLWPKPGSTDRSTKVSYVKKVTCNGTEVVVGCGVYDMTIEDVNGSTK